MNETADDVVIGDKELLGKHFPTSADDMVTLGELLTVADNTPTAMTLPSEEKLKVIDTTIERQTHLTGEQKEQLQQVLVRQHEAVSLGNGDMGRSAAVPHLLRPKSEEPSYVHQALPDSSRSPPLHQRADRQAVGIGVIREDWASSHNSPVFAVKKPHSDELRFVIDMRKVNEIIWDDFHSFVDVTSCLQCLGGLEAKFLSALDLVNAYWQLELAEESQPYTAFTVPGKGKFVWTVTLMGLKTSPSALSRLLEYVFQGFHNAVIYLDDVLIGSRTWDSHLQHLDQALARMKQHNLKIRLRKCKFAEPSVEYLGYTISSGRINPGEEKTAAVKNFAPPQTVKEIRCFTGLCNYFCQFIRGYAGIAGKLTELTALKGHEKNYSAFLLEMAGAAQAIEAFHHYLYGVTFTLMCDHKLMERLGTVHKRTLIRLQELMGQNNFVIKYRPGKMNELADTHSRTTNVCA